MSAELRTLCKQCGFAIVINPRDKAAQDAGFCCTGCFDVYEAIKASEKRANQGEENV